VGEALAGDSRQVRAGSEEQEGPEGGEWPESAVSEGEDRSGEEYDPEEGEEARRCEAHADTDGAGGHCRAGGQAQWGNAQADQGEGAGGAQGRRGDGER